MALVESQGREGNYFVLSYDEVDVCDDTCYAVNTSCTGLHGTCMHDTLIDAALALKVHRTLLGFRDSVHLPHKCILCYFLAEWECGMVGRMKECLLFSQFTFPMRVVCYISEKGSQRIASAAWCIALLGSRTRP